MLNQTPWLEPHYNIANYPIFVAHHGNWDIYRNNAGHCAALPVVEGCRASHFGDYEYARITLSLEGVKLPPLTVLLTRSFQRTAIVQADLRRHPGREFK